MPNDHTDMNSPDRTKCKKILVLMTEAGYQDTALPETVDGWQEDEVDYFLSNYESFYLGDGSTWDSSL